MNDLDLHESRRLYRRLALICLRIMDKGSSDAVRNDLADEADEICRELGLPIVDRSLLGKPFVYGETELQP